MGTQAYTDPNVGSGYPIERALLILTCLSHWKGTKEFQGKFSNVCPPCLALRVVLPGCPFGGSVTGKEPVGTSVVLLVSMSQLGYCLSGSVKFTELNT